MNSRHGSYERGDSSDERRDLFRCLYEGNSYTYIKFNQKNQRKYL